MFASPLFWQIRYLVTNLTKKNLKSSISELNQLIELYGEDARLFLLQCLVEETGFKEQKAHAHHGNKDAQKIQLLQHEVAQAAGELNFVSAICRALEGWGGSTRDRAEQSHGRHPSRGGAQGQQGPHRITEDFLGGFCRSLKLSPAQQVAVGLGLSRSPNPAVAKEGVKFLVARVPGLVGAGNGSHLSLEALHSLLELVNSREDVSAQPRVAKSLLQQIREAHKELLAGLQTDGGSGGGSPHETDAVGGRGTGKSGGGWGGSGGSGASSGSKGVGGGGGDALASSGTADAAASGSGGSFSLGSNSLLEADAVALIPLFSNQNLEMNYLNKTNGAISLPAGVAGIASSIGQGGNLAQFLGELGHSCSSSPAALRQAIRESRVMVDERQVAQVINMLANNYNGSKGQGDDADLSPALTNSLFSSGEGQMDTGRDGGSIGQEQGSWKLDVARQVLSEDYGPRLNWVDVAKRLDHDRFNISDQNALRVLLLLYRGPADRDLPAEALYTNWQNRRGQLSLLRAAISSPPQVFAFARSPTLAPLDGVDLVSATPNGAWLNLDLVVTLLSLASDTELYAQVRDVFSKPAYHCPELLLLALAAVPSDVGGSLRVEMLSRLLPLYFRPNRNTHAAALIRRLWQVNPRLVVQSGVKAFKVDSRLPSVVYVLRIMRLVPECAVDLLGSDDCDFAVAVASVIYGAETDQSDAQKQKQGAPGTLPPLDMGKWCGDRLCRKDKETFATRVLSFVQAHLQTARPRAQAQKPGESPGEGPVPTCPMSLEAAAVFLRALGGMGHLCLATDALVKKYPVILASATKLTEAAKKMYPAIQPLLHQSLPGEEIEDIANSYFQRIYTSEQSIEEVIAMLQRFKSSSDAREQEIFACMVHNLFDEYRFFQNYPEKELRITGVLFGSLIQHQLVSSITLGIALRYVLEALRKPPGPDSMGKMFRFGMFALEQFKSRLGEWPQYCSHIVQIPHLVANHASLVQDIERSMQRPQDQRLPPTAVAPGPPKMTPHGSVAQQQPQQAQHLPKLVPPGALVRTTADGAAQEAAGGMGLGMSNRNVGPGGTVVPSVLHGQPHSQQRLDQVRQDPDRGGLALGGGPVGPGHVQGQQGVGHEHVGLGAEAMLPAGAGQGRMNPMALGGQGDLGVMAASQHVQPQPLHQGGQMGSHIGIRPGHGQQGQQAAVVGQQQPGGVGTPSNVAQQQPLQHQHHQVRAHQHVQLAPNAGHGAPGPSHSSQHPLQQAQQAQQSQPQQAHQPPDQPYGRPATGGQVDGVATYTGAGGGGGETVPGGQLMGAHVPAGGTKIDGAADAGNQTRREGLGPALNAALGFGGQASRAPGNTALGLQAPGGAAAGAGTSIGGGITAGAPGHNTWGAPTPGQGLPPTGAQPDAPANGPGGGGAGAGAAGRGAENSRAPTGALPPKQPEGLGTPNIEQLMAKVEEPTAIVNPPESVMDRIHFVINNVTTNNLSSKVNEIKPHVQDHPEHHPWLANYLVVKRICTQPNFHDLYLELVNQLETPPLMDAILRSVFFNVGKLLKSQKIITSTSERSLLKNLGSWLGKVTLGKDKPVLQRELDIKELLFQGYETGRLIAVTPFVAKILEAAPSGKSRVFKPPNPWIMGLFSALHEMYELQDLKMNIKFEIEMLCQKFNVTLADVPKYGRLRTRMTPQKEKNPDFNLAARTSARATTETARNDRDDAGGAIPAGPGPTVVQEGVGGATAPGVGGGVEGGVGRDGVDDGRGGGGVAANAGRGGVGGAGDRGGAGVAGGQQPTGQGQMKPPVQTMQAPPDQQTVIPNLASYVTINSAMEAFASQPQLKEVLKRVIPVAVDRAIREIIQPVVERSVTIACITSKELVQKDFAMEADDHKMRKAAHLMVSNLAGSLALVTCKEPLRVSIGNHMRSLLATSAPHSDQSTTEMLVQLCSAENLELGCMLIEKAATERAMRDIDEAVAPSLQARRRSRETTGQPFYDMSIFNSLPYPGALPDPLRPKPGGLNPQQLLVYEAFQRVPRQPTVTRSPAGPTALPGPAGGVPGPTPNSPASPALTSVQGVAGPGVAGGRGLSPKGGELTLDHAMSAWQNAISRLDMAIGGLLQAHRRQGGPEPTLHTANRDQELSAALQEIVTVGKSVPVQSREEALTKFARAVFNRLFDMARGKEDSPTGVPLLRVEVYAAVLELCLRTVKTSQAAGRKEDMLSQWYTTLPPPALAGAGSRKLHLGAMKYLVQMNTVELGKIDAFLARNITLPMQQQGTQQQQQQQQLLNQLQDEWGLYAVDFIRQCVFEHTDATGPEGKAYQLATMKSFSKSLEVLSQLQEKRPLVTAKFIQLAADLRVATHSDQGRKLVGPGADGANASMHGVKGDGRAPGGPGMGQARNEAASVRDEVTQLLHYWMRLNENSAADEGAILAFLSLINQRNIIKTEESTDRFLRVATELVLEACLKSNRPQAATQGEDKPKGVKQLSYAVVDAYVKLLVVLIRSRQAPDPAAAVNGRVTLLSRVLTAIVRAIIQDFEAKRVVGSTGGASPFDQRPYFRLLLGLLQDINKPDRNLDTTSMQVLMPFSSAFHAVNPGSVPGFAFAWLELISHRAFMPSLLLAKQNKGWHFMHRLLVDLFVFMEPHLRRPSLMESVRVLYTGMLRTLLVLLHDFPEFLCDYHLSFCDVIPPACIQLRNLVLSAFPRSMRLPDPFTPNLKVDLLPEIALAPRILSNYVVSLSHNNIRSDLDKFLQTRNHPMHFLTELAGKLRLSPQEAAHTGMTYNVPCINALVVYVGSQAILQLNHKTPVITHSAPMDIFHQLANKLDPEGRYFFLNAVANQLRYPNQHTHYFSCVLLYLFAEAQSEMVQEQITRILLERLIVHRPHPWGVLITFIELIKNPRYSFWSHSFTHCAPELERVFESVARSCMTPGASGAVAGAEDDGTAAGTAQ